MTGRGSYERPRTSCVYCGARITPPNHGGRCAPLRRFVRSLACRRHWDLVLIDAFYRERVKPW